MFLDIQVVLSTALNYERVYGTGANVPVNERGIAMLIGHDKSTISRTLGIITDTSRGLFVIDSGVTKIFFRSKKK